MPCLSYVLFLSSCVSLAVREKQAGVAVAQETVVAGKGVVVERTPAVAYKGRHEQEQSGLRLMEVRYHAVDDAVAVARCDDYACVGHQGVFAEAVEPGEYGFHGFGHAQCRMRGVVGVPLSEFARPLSAADKATYVVEAFERAHRSGADCYDRPFAFVAQAFYHVAAYGDELAVHVVSAYHGCFHGAEGAGADVERHFAALYACAVDGFEKFGSEVQSGCRSRYGAFDFAENGLIVRGVALFRFAVEVWLMDESVLGDFIDDEGQKLLYVFDYMTDRAFFIEMTEMITGKTLKDPLCTLSLGQAPSETVDLDEFDAKIDSKAAAAANVGIDDLDEDFYGSDTYNPDEFDTESFDEMTFDDKF